MLVCDVSSFLNTTMTSHQYTLAHKYGKRISRDAQIHPKIEPCVFLHIYIFCLCLYVSCKERPKNESFSKHIKKYHKDFSVSFETVKIPEIYLYS